MSGELYKLCTPQKARRPKSKVPSSVPRNETIIVPPCSYISIETICTQYNTHYKRQTNYYLCYLISHWHILSQCSIVIFAAWSWSNPSGSFHLSQTLALLEDHLRLDTAILTNSGYAVDDWTLLGKSSFWDELRIPSYISVKVHGDDDACIPIDQGRPTQWFLGVRAWNFVGEY